ncbi:MAG TPA: hypothetical protein VIC06_07265 [Solirubrobacteraceae bacterium]
MYHLYPHDEEPQPLDWQLLGYVLNSYDDQPQPWTLKQLEAQFGDTEAVLGSLRRLQRYGLVTRLGFYVIASQPALFFHHMLKRFGGDVPTGGDE